MTAHIMHFRDTLEAKIQALFRDSNPKSTMAPVAIVLEEGPKYTRIVRSLIMDGTVVERSAYGFIVNATGDLLKADGWKRPAKGIRGNLGDADPLARCGQYSIR